MAQLYELLEQKVKKWRKSDYQSDFSVIGEILDFAFVGLQNGDKKLMILKSFSKKCRQNEDGVKQRFGIQIYHLTKS